MKTQTATAAIQSQTTSGVMAPALLALTMGLGLIVLAGHVQADALHDAAHDVRHATGFPCH